MADYGAGQGSNLKQERTASRIDNDVEQLKRFVDRIKAITERVVRHAHSLGYFDAATGQNAGAQTPIPITTSLADAILDLDRAIDGCSGALNVFD